MGWDGPVAAHDGDQGTSKLNPNTDLITMTKLISPYGGQLIDLMLPASELARVRQDEMDLPSLALSWQQVGQVELVLSGAYSPITGFMGRADLYRVLSELRLSDGLSWPLPVVLALDSEKLGKVQVGDRVGLRDGEGLLIAILDVAEIWPADANAETAMAESSGAPLGKAMARDGQWYVAGQLLGVSEPPHHDFSDLRLTPAEIRSEFARRGWRNVIAYQPSLAMHRVHLEFLTGAAAHAQANLLLHVAGGADPVGDPEHFSLVRACRAILPRFPSATTLMAVSSSPRFAPGIRANLMRAILARNFGCASVVVGGEAWDDGMDRRGGDGVSFPDHGPIADCAREIGVQTIPFPRMVYVEERDEYFSQDNAPTNSRELVMGGEELRRRLSRGLRIPDWFTYPEVLVEMARCHPPRHRQGFTVFFTGLSGAGKSTVANVLAIRLMELGGRRVTLLDGDLVRRNLSSELGFSREHRDLNIRRIGYVAEEITKHGGIAICAPIAPYRVTRDAVRRRIEPWGGFLEIHMATPIEVCERRDRKGLYAKARAGIIREFTGVSDPYEIPQNPELAIDTSNCDVEEAVQSIVLKLEHEGYLK